MLGFGLGLEARAAGVILDTNTFLTHILPEQGYKFVVIREGDDKPWIHKAFDSIEKMGRFVQAAEARGLIIYHACAAYHQEVIVGDEISAITGKPKKRYRIQENAAFAKSFWVDLDCGDGKDYEGQREAVRDLGRVLSESGLGQFGKPLLVSSGYGIHAYWVLDREITAAQWRKIAAMWRAVLDHFGLKHDSSRTTDVTSILRPPGTTNRKRGGEAPVKVLNKDVPAAVDVLAFLRHLKALIAEHRIDVSPVADKSKPQLNSDLAMGPESYTPKSAHLIADHCAQIRAMRDAQGDIGEPVWYAGLGLLKHTIEGEQICHEWSSGHPEYDPKVTQQKIIQWGFGPPTCKKFEQLNPSGCDGCPHKDKVKSPIMLGELLPENEAPPVDAGTPQIEEIERKLREIPPPMQKTFSWSNNSLNMLTKLPDGTQHVEHITDIYLAPVDYSVDATGKSHSEWVARLKPGVYHQFSIPTSLVAAGGRELTLLLGQNKIVVRNKKAMEMYISDWFNHLRRETEEVQSYSTFGWHKDEFVLGERIYRPDGSVDEVRLAGDAVRYAEAFSFSGSLDRWVAGVDALYNREGHEQFQWMIGAGFGAPLLSLMGGTTTGVTINGYSPETAQGKSTAGKVALSIFGNPEKIGLTKQQATAKGLFAFSGLMKSLPILLDEVTNVTGRELSEMVYTFSQGNGRVGATSDGGLRHSVHSWSTLMICTSNRSLHSTLAAAKADATPEIARVFEYKFRRPSNIMTKLEADEIVPDLLGCSGVAGDKFMRYVVANQQMVRDALSSVRVKFTKASGCGQEDRYWVAAATAVLTGLLIAKKLELISFDVAALMRWAVEQAKGMKVVSAESASDPAEQFGLMLQDLSSGILVTDRMGDARYADYRAQILSAPRGELKGRLIVDEGMLYLPASVVRAWCSENQADYKQMVDTITWRLWGKAEPLPFALGRGTSEYPSAPVRVIRIDMAAAGAEMHVPKHLANQANLRVVK